MVFKCQEDSFLKEFTSKVVSCEETQFEIKLDDGKAEKRKGFAIILEDTIIFPEGGGQPTDHGLLNDLPVNQVVRMADRAIHYVDKPLEVGEMVNQKIDWERRFDHMQQHSGQHLLSAVFEREYNLTTVSWWLGEEMSHIELDAPNLTDSQIRHVEHHVNESIRQGKKVFVEVYKEDAPEEELKKARSAKGLPDDHKGDIRVINIEGIDRNMCCGTHVTNLSQLQLVKLLHSEKSKRKDKTLLYFLVGNRVLNKLQACIEREQKLTLLLNNNPMQHIDLVEKLLKNVKLLNKNLKNVLKELAIKEAHKLKNSDDSSKYFSLHIKEAEADFMNIFLKEFGNSTNILLFLSTGNENTVGNFVLHGTEKAVTDLGPKICELLDGKGNGKGNKYQAKVTKMSNRTRAIKLIEDYYLTNV